MEMEPTKSTFKLGEEVQYLLRRHEDDLGDQSHEYHWSVRDAEGHDLRDGVVNFDDDEVVRYLRPDPHRPLPVGGPYFITVWKDADKEVEVGSDRFWIDDPAVKVALGRAAMLSPNVVDMDPCPTFAGFEAFLKDRALVAGSGLPLAWTAANPGTTPPFGSGPGSYDELMDAARAYVQTCDCDDLTQLAPLGYIERVARNNVGWQRSPDLSDRQGLPCLELIYSYWLEEGMLVQTMNHVLARFQNRRVAFGDPLARFDVSPLLPLRSLLWSWVENEQRRLTVRRRAAEYQYEYGLTLIGKALPSAQTYVERRSGFVPAFHTVLHLATQFFREADDLTISPDGFKVYEALREAHLVMSQGSQNQYGEMAVAARAEMLVMQYILAQPPMREFLGGRPMTPYPEPWMDRVDSMKAIQGWADTSVLHFYDLAVLGEKLAITIRLGNWAAPTSGAAQAATWVLGFRPAIQRYVAAYRAVTGVDLTNGVDATMPSTLLARRLRDVQRRA